MKLLFCRECHDIVKLRSRGGYAVCACKKSRGKYKRDGHHAKVSGPCMVLGIDNRQMAQMVRGQLAGLDVRPEVFVIREPHERIERVMADGKPQPEAKPQAKPEAKLPAPQEYTSATFESLFGKRIAQDMQRPTPAPNQELLNRCPSVTEAEPT